MDSQPSLDEIHELRKAIIQRISAENVSVHSKDLQRIKDDDDWLRRFLMHTDLKQNEALQMTSNVLKWRNEYGTNDLVQPASHHKCFFPVVAMSDNEFSGGILTVIDTEILIKEIEKRPALFNKQLKEYSDRNVKEKLWAEVCTQVIQNWNELAAKDKKIKGAEVQKKWKNLKDCFQRELAAQRNTVSGQGAKKRRKYIHFDDLLFLVPFVKGRESSSNVSRSDNDDEQERSQGNHLLDKSVNPSTVDEQARPVLPGKNKKSNNVTTTYEQSLLNILKAKQSDEVNEDRNFALMLVPMLGKLNDEQKHYAKVEILNVMRNARHFNPQPQPVFSELSRHHQQASGQWPHGQTCNYYNENNSPSTASLQSFYDDFSASVVSPSSASGSDIFDLSHQ